MEDKLFDRGGTWIGLPLGSRVEFNARVKPSKSGKSYTIERPTKVKRVMK